MLRLNALIISTTDPVVVPSPAVELKVLEKYLQATQKKTEHQESELCLSKRADLQAYDT